MFSQNLKRRPNICKSTANLLAVEHQNAEHMEQYNLENSILHRKLQSKTEALRILRKELEKFRTERDQFKLMAETLQLHYSATKRRPNVCLDGSKSSIANLLHDTRERNFKLTTELEALKQKLSELQGDLQLLRAKDAQMLTEQQTKIPTPSKEQLQWKEERSHFISHLEALKKRNMQLAFDLKTLIGEKEETITERDAYKCKAHRLNHELLKALKVNETHSKFLDIDSILLENKYLLDRLQCSENELEMTKQAMSKYKIMLESKRKKGIIKLGTDANDDNIFSHKQVKVLLENGVELPTKADTIKDLKGICLTLLDNLSDKNLALNHQKRTNKILAGKIAELEQRVQAAANTTDASSSITQSDISSAGYSPSQMLLNGYSAAQVDNHNLTENKCTQTQTAAMASNGHGYKQTQLRVYDDGVSSISADESTRSVLSSEYEFDINNFNQATSATDSAGASNRCSLPEHILRERERNFSDLPPTLRSRLYQTLQQLDEMELPNVQQHSTAEEQNACLQLNLEESFQQKFALFSSAAEECDLLDKTLNADTTDEQNTESEIDIDKLEDSADENDDIESVLEYMRREQDRINSADDSANAADESAKTIFHDEQLLAADRQLPMNNMEENISDMIEMQQLLRDLMQEQQQAESTLGNLNQMSLELRHVQKSDRNEATLSEETPTTVELDTSAIASTADETDSIADFIETSNTGSLEAATENFCTSAQVLPTQNDNFATIAQQHSKGIELCQSEKVQ